jgi:NADH-quinone oxidoreductase subunit E
MASILKHVQPEAEQKMETLFTPDEQKQFDSGISEMLSHYPPERKSAAMLPALRLLQSMKGWLPPAGMEQVAQKLATTTARAYEVATFYVMYHTQKPGKYVIDVCTNLSCALRGAEGMLRHLEDKLGTKAGVNGEKYFLRETECLASCGTAPCLQINEDHHENLTRAKVDALLEKMT